MPSITPRSMELHKIIISGIGANANYFEFINKIYSFHKTDEDRPILNISGKKHVLQYVGSSTSRYKYQQLIFYSYKTGNRPDVLTESNQEIEENPLNVDQTFIDWTYIIMEKVHNDWYLAIEKHNQGIFPKTVEKYLQLLCNKYINSETKDVIINIEPVPSPEFIQRLDALSIVKSAAIRYSRPNPTSWDELDGLLMSGASESNAAKAEVEMIAGRSDGLSQKDGIVKEIKDRYQNGTLGVSRITGKTGDGKEDSFSTEKLIIKDRVQVETDVNGKVDKHSISRMLSDFLRREIK